MDEETFNRTKRMFLKRLADCFWADGQWKFAQTFQKNQGFAREKKNKLSQALRGCVKRDSFPTMDILKNLVDYFSETEFSDIAEARTEQERRLKEEKKQHMKVLGAIQGGSRKRLTNLKIEPGAIFSLPNGNKAEFTMKTDGGNFIFKEIKNYQTHLLTEQEARQIVEEN